MYNSYLCVHSLFWVNHSVLMEVYGRCALKQTESWDLGGAHARRQKPEQSFGRHLVLLVHPLALALRNCIIGIDWFTTNWYHQLIVLAFESCVCVHRATKSLEGRSSGRCPSLGTSCFRNTEAILQAQMASELRLPHVPLVMPLLPR